MEYISNSGNETLWIVPTHGPSHLLFVRFVETFRENTTGIDLMVVTSTAQEASLLSDLNVDYIFSLDSYYSKSEVGALIGLGSVINVKKLLGLNLVRGSESFRAGNTDHQKPVQEPTRPLKCQKYKNIVVTDDEVEILRPLHGRDLESSKVTYAMHPTNGALDKIIYSPITLMAKNEDRALATKFLVTSGSPYGWFSNPPVYSATHLEEFLEMYGLGSPRDLFRLTYNTFDFNLYLLFLNTRRPHEFRSRVKLYSSWPPPLRIQGSWWEWGFITREGRQLLKEDAASRRVLWTADRKVFRKFFRNQSGREPTQARICFHTDRNFADSGRAHAPMRFFRTILGYIGRQLV